MSDTFSLEHLLEKRIELKKSYFEFLRVPALSAGIYVLPAGGTDPQSPHQEDEIYYVVAGAAKVRMGADERSLRQGDVVFVEAGIEHRFFDIKKELVLLVVFAPAESA